MAKVGRQTDWPNGRTTISDARLPVRKGTKPPAFLAALTVLRQDNNLKLVQGAGREYAALLRGRRRTTDSLARQLTSGSRSDHLQREREKKHLEAG